MATLQVQSASTVAPTTPAATAAFSTSVGEDSFAVTYGRALENMPGSVQGGSSLAPKAPSSSPAASRAKGASRDRSDSSSMGGILLSCLAPNVIPPAPNAAVSLGTTWSTASLQRGQSNCSSQPDIDSGLITSETQASAKAGTLSTAAAMGRDLTALGTMSGDSSGPNGTAWASLAGTLAGAATGAASESTPGARSQVVNPSVCLDTAPAEDSTPGATTPPSVSAPLSYTGLQDPLPLKQFPDSQAGIAPSASQQTLPSNPGLALDSGPRQGSQTLSGFTSLGSPSEKLGTAQMQAVPRSTLKESGSSLDSVAITAAEAASSDATASVQTAQYGTSPGLQATEVAVPGVAGPSDLVGDLSAEEISLNVSGNESQQTTAPEELSARGTPTVTAQFPSASKVENLVNTPAQVVLHSAQGSVSVSTGAAGQVAAGLGATSAQATPTLPPIPASSRQEDSKSRSAAGATPWQQVASSDSTQASGVASASPSENGAQPNLGDSSTSGQAKPGQHSGDGTGGNSAGVILIAPGTASNSAADSTANLLTIHTPSVPVTHTAASVPQTPPPTQPPTTLSAWQNYDGGAGSLVRSASLSASGGAVEMHMEFRSGALGPLEVHAVMREGSVGAEIHVQGQEAHTLLAAGLPSLERALGERNLRVENIAVYQDNARGGTGEGGKQDHQPGSPPSPQQQALPWANSPQSSQSASGSLEDEELANTATGLSIQA